MTEFSKIEFKTLIQELEKDPTNLDLINSVAIGYFENYDLKLDKEDFDYFEKAYLLKKTVKSTHNFAWFLYFEWSEIEWRWKEDSAISKAIKIQKECIELNPKTFYPYYQLGYMLIDQKQFKEAIPYWEKAKRKENKRNISHNLGYCYFQLKEYEKAKELFSISVTELDIEKRSLFNLALTEYKCQNLDKVKAIADKLSEEIETNHHSTISGYEIGLLYFLLNDLDKSAKCLIKQGIEGIDLLDWNELSYSLYQMNKPIWSKQINKGIKERTEWIDEINGNHEDWSEYSTQEKQERLNELRVEIQTRENTLKTEMTKPKQEIIKSLWVEYCGCLMFDWLHSSHKRNFLIK
jgi:tetratricopeptide (TPR) repeat protein